MRVGESTIVTVAEGVRSWVCVVATTTGGWMAGYHFLSPLPFAKIFLRLYSILRHTNINRSTR